MHATDRVVLVGAGFGVWHGGRHAASARWADVTRVRAFGSDEATTGQVGVTLELRDGITVTVHEGLPGFAAFLAAAEQRLPGMRQRTSWSTEVTRPAVVGSEVVVFERGAPGI